MMKNDIRTDAIAARRTFDQACEGLRPDLHRFCTRMLGNPCDGEDVLQEALVLAFYRIEELRDSAALRAWIFRIAHNKCIDFLRVGSRHRFDSLDAVEHEHEATTVLSTLSTLEDTIELKTRANRTLANIVAVLPPKERACIVLKDVLDCSLEETAEITESNVGAVKAALHRAREKLERAEGEATTRSASKANVNVNANAIEPRKRAIIERYLALFNARNWDGVQALLTDEARLEVVNRSEGPFKDACYFERYGQLKWIWKLALAHVDGVETIVHFRKMHASDSTWKPHAIVRLRIEAANGKVSLVRDYNHVAYLLSDCVVDERSESLTWVGRPKVVDGG